MADLKISTYSNKVLPVPADKMLGTDTEAANATKNFSFGDILTWIENNIALTKADVGLPNVQDFPIATQIEAEAGLLDDKYMTPLKTSQAITSQVVFGDNYQYGENIIQQSNSSLIPLEYMNITTPIIDAGTYRIDWTYFWRLNNVSNDFVGQIFLDGVNVYPVFHQQEAKDPGANQNQVTSGSVDVVLTNAVHTVQILFGVSNAANVATVNYGNLRIYRVA